MKELTISTAADLNGHEWKQHVIRKGCCHDMPCSLCSWSDLGKYIDFIAKIYVLLFLIGSVPKIL